MPVKCRLGLLLSAIFLVLLSGCALYSRTNDEAGMAAPSGPQPSSSPGTSRVLLLDPGAIQLGPGVSKNAYRWMGDGQWGF